MATIGEISDDFSERIRNAVGHDEPNLRGSPSESLLRRSFTLRTVRRLAREIAFLTVEKSGTEERAIGEEEKNEIIEVTAEKLGIKNRQVLRRVFQEAGNPNVVVLTNDMAQLVREIKK